MPCFCFIFKFSINYYYHHHHHHGFASWLSYFQHVASSAINSDLDFQLSSYSWMLSNLVRKWLSPWFSIPGTLLGFQLLAGLVPSLKCDSEFWETAKSMSQKRDKRQQKPRIQRNGKSRILLILLPALFL